MEPLEMVRRAVERAENAGLVIARGHWGVKVQAGVYAPREVTVCPTGACLIGEIATARVLGEEWVEGFGEEEACLRQDAARVLGVNQDWVEGFNLAWERVDNAEDRLQTGYEAGLRLIEERIREEKRPAFVY